MPAKPLKMPPTFVGQFQYQPVRQSAAGLAPVLLIYNRLERRLVDSQRTASVSPAAKEPQGRGICVGPFRVVLHPLHGYVPDRCGAFGQFWKAAPVFMLRTVLEPIGSSLVGEHHVKLPFAVGGKANVLL